MRVLVVGGGISGLSAAYRLRQSGCEVVVLEADDRPGGKIRSEISDGYLVEHGPNGFLDSRTAVIDLVGELGLEGQLLPANEEAARRYVFSRGWLRALPRGPLSLLVSGLLTPRGLLRLLCEPFIKARLADTSPGTSDESVFDFAKRRIGREAAEVLVDAMVSGIYAGDARHLSLASAFPKMATFESTYGGLVKALYHLMKGRKVGTSAAAGPGGRLTSFPGGLEVLVKALARQLEGQVLCGRRAVSLERGQGTLRVVTDGKAGLETFEAERVVLALPAESFATLLGPHSERGALALRQIPYASAAVVALGYPLGTLPRPLDGFGFLVPGVESRQILGSVFCSTLFPGRAARGRVLMRAILGGVRHPELLGEDDTSLLALTRSELDITMGGPMPDSVFHRVIRWPAAIPQYDVGHAGRVAAIEAALSELPGVFSASNAMYGVSLADCVARAVALPPLVNRPLA